MNVKKLGFCIVFGVLMIMTACGTGDQKTENGNGTEKIETPANQPETPETDTPIEDSQNPPKVNDEQSESTAFRNISVSGENGEYVVNGEARVFEAVFFYSVEEGHEYLIEETKVTADEGAPAWSPFELKISIPEDQLPINGTLTLELYEKSAKDGSVINETFVKLEEFGF
ncbi:spore germination protein, immunogloblin-like domain-containing [Schinkia azotoformans MEV2011]|uniref:Bacterial spore germination immunoglobulin-like domain-containing protein n=2 Tax=Schinkia azotoformans TaxID=1454 RepID=K6BWL9_SCHAZ|nr:Gmad2 immunoglobulin-like domain-containing protein [Schinkia azotoformans]EKN63335.1 hypothetical protein BAZO_16724 [Schinkia azotoformans LMG 9581]KEF38291.1 spore germination protein, immunogloblin-like domain-containing [Schinkia azotoformans MEV2011]MEC1640415.1 Gmad2 immunoglobulin-like domain-containing protein [Schinkia azotoformans]MEC1694035.1 Gmad2 immunoglobulin-like domain-containing protein [Schinkia azotoformans]MEC1715747.1 Gmad2 immunoglobulin-like domain-containing protei